MTEVNTQSTYSSYEATRRKNVRKPLSRRSLANA